MAKPPKPGNSATAPKPVDQPQPTPQSKSQIHLVGGRKGGVGKTFLSRLLAEYLTRKKQQFALIEADVTIGDVGTVYGGFDKGKSTKALDLSLSDDPRRYNEPDIIFREALEKQCVLVNLPAETNDALSSWMSAVNLVGLCKENNIDLWHWYVTDGCYASIRLLADSLKILDGQLPHIIIRNEGRLNGLDFSYLEKNPIYKDIQKSKNVVGIYDFPVLGNAEQFYLDEQQLTYEQGVQNAIKDLGIIQAQRIKTFTEGVIAVLDEIFNVALPTFAGGSAQSFESPNPVGEEATEPSVDDADSDGWQMNLKSDEPSELDAAKPNLDENGSPPADPISEDKKEGDHN